MNPASRIWDIPPPPGTEDEFPPIVPVIKTERQSPPLQLELSPEVQKDDTEKSETLVKTEVTDTTNIKKEPEEPAAQQIVVKKEKDVEQDRVRHTSKSRSQSRTRDKYRKRRHSRSRSRDRHRRSRSRSRRRRRRYNSTSRSRSRTPSFRRRRRSKHRYSSSRHSRSKSRSRSRSPSRYRHKSYRSRKDRERSHRSRSASPRHSKEGPLDADTNEVDMKLEDEDEEDETLKDNVFKNDGSFLEMFKKMQEQQQKAQEPTPSPEEIKKPILPTFGKRRGGKVLKTGMVQKIRQPTDEENATDAWSVYMKEVRRYKEACCDDDSKTRPLVK